MSHGIGDAEVSDTEESDGAHRDLDESSGDPGHGGYDIRAPFGGTFLANGKSIAWTVWQGKGQGHLRFHPMHDHEKWIVEHQPRLVRGTSPPNDLQVNLLNMYGLIWAHPTMLALKVLAVMDKIHHSLVRGKRVTMAGPQDAMRDWGYMVGRNLASVVIDEAHVCSGMLGANAFWYATRSFEMNGFSLKAHLFIDSFWCAGYCSELR